MTMHQDESPLRRQHHLPYNVYTTGQLECAEYGQAGADGQPWENSIVVMRSSLVTYKR